MAGVGEQKVSVGQCVRVGAEPAAVPRWAMRESELRRGSVLAK